MDCNNRKMVATSVSLYTTIMVTLSGLLFRDLYKSLNIKTLTLIVGDQNISA